MIFIFFYSFNIYILVIFCQKQEKTDLLKHILNKEEGMITHSSILVWRIHMDRGAWLATVHAVAKSQI